MIRTGHLSHVKSLCKINDRISVAKMEHYLARNKKKLPTFAREKYICLWTDNGRSAHGGLFTELHETGLFLRDGRNPPKDYTNDPFLPLPLSHDPEYIKTIAVRLMTTRGLKTFQSETTYEMIE